jgi:hypothetical protein
VIPIQDITSPTEGTVFVFKNRTTEEGRFTAHFKENPIYIHPEIKLCGLSPNLNINVPVSHSHIPIIDPPIFLQQKRQTDGGNK